MFAEMHEAQSAKHSLINTKGCRAKDKTKAPLGMQAENECACVFQGLGRDAGMLVA